MVGVDERLEGIKMRLRPSMNKFKALDEEIGEIEIARAFDRPGVSYLNRCVSQSLNTTICNAQLYVHRPLVMIMEDRGVDKNAFIELQERTKTDIHTASDSMELFYRLLKVHKLGQAFGLDYIIRSLRTIGMGFKHEKDVTVLKDPFIDRLIHFAKNDVLRDVKHGARIPIPDSYLLVGIADEGPAYEAEGVENVYTLKENEIFGAKSFF